MTKIELKIRSLEDQKKELEEKLPALEEEWNLRADALASAKRFMLPKKIIRQMTDETLKASDIYWETLQDVWFLEDEIKLFIHVNNFISLFRRKSK